MQPLKQLANLYGLAAFNDAVQYCSMQIGQANTKTLKDEHKYEQKFPQGAHL